MDFRGRVFVVDIGGLDGLLSWRDGGFCEMGFAAGVGGLD